MNSLIIATLFLSAATLPKEDAFKILDKDKDGYVSSDEAAADEKLSVQFDSLDRKPKDGKLDRDEYKVYFHANNSRRNQNKN